MFTRGNKIRTLRMSDEEYEKTMSIVEAHGYKYLSQLLKKINSGELEIVRKTLDK